MHHFPALEIEGATWSLPGLLSSLHLDLRDMFAKRFLLRFVALPVVLPLVLAGCGGSDTVQTDPSYQNKEHDALYKNGSLLSDEGGWDMFGGDKTRGADNGIGVNGFLWRAALDTISFMPITSADPFGGVILTDWYSPPDNPAERTRLNVFIRDRDLRADGIKVSVFRQSKGGDGTWTDAPVAAATGSSIENAILTRAREIRLAQKQFQ